MNEWIVYSLHVAGVCVWVGVWVCKNAIEIENGFVCTHGTHFRAPNSICQKYGFKLKINSKTHHLFNLFCGKYQTLWHRVSTERILHVSIAFFVSNTSTIAHPRNTLSTDSVVFQTLQQLNIFTNILDFVCLFIYFSRVRLEVGNGQKCVISHPFTRAFRQTPKQSTAHPSIHTHGMYVCNK